MIGHWRYRSLAAPTGCIEMLDRSWASHADTGLKLAEAIFRILQAFARRMGHNGRGTPGTDGSHGGCAAGQGRSVVWTGPVPPVIVVPVG